jgi:cell division septation protein DedD
MAAHARTLAGPVRRPRPGGGVDKAEVRDRRFWRLRIGGFSRVSDANEFCGRLRVTGASCWTVELSPGADRLD